MSKYSAFGPGRVKYSPAFGPRRVIYLLHSQKNKSFSIPLLHSRKKSFTIPLLHRPNLLATLAFAKLSSTNKKISVHNFFCKTVVLIYKISNQAPHPPKPNPLLRIPLLHSQKNTGRKLQQKNTIGVKKAYPP